MSSSEGSFLENIFPLLQMPLTQEKEKIDEMLRCENKWLFFFNSLVKILFTYPKIYAFKAYNSMVFGIFSVV